MAGPDVEAPAGGHRRVEIRNELERLAWPPLTDGFAETIRSAATARELATGEVLFEVGQSGYDFFLIESGSVNIVDRADDHVVISIAAPNFLGEFGLLMGQGTFLAATAAEPSRVLSVPQERMRELIATVPEIGDVVVAAYAARRRLLIEWGEGGLTVVGDEGEPATMQLLEFVGRNRIAYRFVDRADRTGVARVLRDCELPDDAVATGPVVITRNAKAVVAPSRRELATALGMDLAADVDDVFDLLVVGGGPAGLAAAVYGASEGLNTVVVEDVAIGGQAGTSSRIENYLGFATGVSGSELAYQGQIQAVKFGARFTVPRRATALRSEDRHLLVDLDDGSTVQTRAVLLACGVQYRRLPLEHLEELEGAGVYYAATELEARFCRNTEAVIVGGGNSAGQAAMFLSRYASCTHVLLRGDHLATTMSSYLSERLEHDSRITLHPHTEVVALHGDARLEAVSVRDRSTGELTRIDTRALFIMIGAAPNTDWLGDVLELDDKGFVATGHVFDSTRVDPARADPYATSLPGVWAVGDVRSESVKRVASAVGEGSVVVAAIHRYLA